VKIAIPIVLIVAVMIFSQVIFADECMEGDCENGIGKGFTEEGKLYDGEWLYGEPHGQGRLFVSKKKIIEGRWQNGKLIEEKEDKKVLQRK
jgi:hypothetical protein